MSTVDQAGAGRAALQVLEAIRQSHPALIADNAPAGWGMTRFRSELGGREIEFKAIGEGSGGHADSVLHGQMSMLGTAFHVTAIQVETDAQGGLKAVADDYGDDLDHVYALSGSSLSTTEIGGRQYVVFVIPHAT